MDEATSDLKLPLQNDCESLQIHVEVHQKSNSTAKKEDIKLSVLKLLNRHNVIFGDYKWIEFDDCYLTNNVQSIAIVDTELQLKDRQPISLNKCKLLIHIFHLNEEESTTENLDAEDEHIIAANHWLLPTVEFHRLWESLIYDAEIKSDVSPPGTGKTSLCRAMAQKLTIRLSHRYCYGQLVEINSHSLFSKWFSESGKLVTKMFQKIQELIDDKDALVFVLIDEVESLTAARSAFQAGTEPSDAIRVVNAVLTQIDQIKRKSEGLSGRILRKLPFLAHALYIQSPNVVMTTFLQALSLAVDKQFEERAKLSDCV
ncbi:Pachytene checkpoint protein 2-like protein [Ophiophagus hannah]|uniref:Pachytene checkpoint protein 2 homolog n=1 Tax=Ophiophagus hannah TaxID=8665 RepID=V8NWP5_OPHHA|nr:Pachytene checkpoint protein 2-like protein [Ophiophagus hannah]